MMTGTIAEQVKPLLQLMREVELPMLRALDRALHLILGNRGERSCG
jgi:hypothetical protein